ncbi:dihydrolipoamide acetyltransferase component of pyruvate dehydrogenase complex [Oceanobacillus oncorhynchi subsp. incaldanensis]|uniref:dihydrolipoamide acetyltransferase family protein n=1 Tax=Oceanobacillus oncorhynchi TaxID=545501 RepID=UPI001B2C5D49|nr:dihydrolipoamide acetyltransferase family protein [Oceanobacillus oncorhynchi]GIO20345.1 dihydrolipoamide acetyltransferase component of pyruvate dehydrogenase complex [Oceanobacillus oncorhynchi subsp. incaldanensis]
MAEKVLMPKLGAQMEEGTIVSWLVQIGESIEEGDPLVEVQTDKITMEIEAEVDGILLKTLYEPDSVVAVQQPIAIIGEEGEAIEEVEEPAVNEQKTADRKGGTEDNESKTEVFIEKSSTDNSEEGKVRRTPAARKFALDKEVNLNNVTGTGPLGRIQKDDVLFYLQEHVKKMTPLAKKIAEDQQINTADIQGTGVYGKIHKKDLLRSLPKQEEQNKEEMKRIPFKGMRKVIADRISESAYTSPHVTLHSEVDMTNVVDLRKQLLPVIEEDEGVRISFNDILLKATAVALKKNPGINIQLTDNEIVYHSQINLGMAVAVKDGLVVPVLQDVDQKGLATITQETKAIGRKARDGKLSHDDFIGSTFTVSNLGMYAVDGFTPIINSPNAAILGVGRIQKKPVVIEDDFLIRSMMSLSLSFDHRIIDGAPAAQFLTDLKDLLEKPFKLMV